jgi:hypothetical protein
MTADEQLQWITLANGRLTLRGRPGNKLIARLPQAGVSCVVTLLSAREGGQLAGMAWLWLPLDNGQYPTPQAQTMLVNGLPDLWDALERGCSVLIHCAAGIHRTGMVAYGLLRWRGHSADEALILIGQMRTHTRDGLQVKQLQWGDEISHLEL